MADLGTETIGDVAPRFEEVTIVKEEPCDPEPAGGAFDGKRPSNGTDAASRYEEEIATAKTEVMDVELSSSETAELDEEPEGSRDRDRLSPDDARNAKYKCETCGYSTRYKRNMVGHAYAHSGRKRPPVRDGAAQTFSCPFCDRAYFEGRDLDLHVDVKHVRGRRFGRLLERLERVRPFGCSRCGYAASSKGALEQHALARHSGERGAHRCAECRFATHFEGNLVKHVAAVHGGERPFECAQPGCGFRSARRYNLQRHVAYRHGIKRDRDRTEG